MRSRGFALIEVLVALAFIGLALPALLIRMQGIVSSTIYYEEKTYAHWVADNRLEQLKAEAQLNRPVSRVRKDSDIVEYGGREWQVNLLVEEMPMPPILEPAKLFRVNIEVALQENPDRKLANIAGYFSE
jgi:general secretion pathway protein I